MGGCRCRARMTALGDQMWRIRGILTVLGPLTSTLLPFDALATTWKVSANETEPSGRIATVIEQMSSGDTLLVGPGLYYEHIELPMHLSLTMIGTGGASVTILDGSQDCTPGRGGIIMGSPIHEAGPSYEGTLSLSGLTFRNGCGGRKVDGPAGGAICLFGVGQGQIEILNCVFEDNIVEAERYLSYGGAIFVSWYERILIRSCSFARNEARGLASYGGSIALESGGADLGTNVIADSEFALGPQVDIWEGHAIWGYGGTIDIVDCSFAARGNAVSWGAEAVSLMNWGVRVTGNTFRDEGGALAATVKIATGAEFPGGDPPPYVIIERNEVSAGEGRKGWFELVRDAEHVWIRDNSFFNMNVDLLSSSSSSEYLVSNNNFVRCSGRAGGSYHGVAWYRCNNAWPDTLGLNQIVQGELNLNVDPLLCGERGEDLRLAEESPCASGNAPGGCGQIGALGVGCRITAVRRLSWGAIRGLYR